jgi:hypothetical protein
MKKLLLVLALLFASPVAAQNHADVVQQLAAEAPAEKTLEGALQFTLRVVGRLNALYPAERAGLLVKPSGENVIPYSGSVVSAGRICYPSGQLFKVLTDVPTTNGPSWQDNGTVDPSRYLAVTDAQPPIVLPGQPPVVPPPVFDAAAIAAQIAQLQLSLDTHARGLSEAIAVVNQNVSDGRADNRSAWAKVADHWKSITMVAAPVITWWTTRQMQAK